MTAGVNLIEKLHARTTPALSVEFFPPKTPAAEATLSNTIREMASLDLAFVSVTYGAGGSTRDRTRDLVVDLNRPSELNQQGQRPAVAHLTCIGHTKDQLNELLDDYDRNGVHDILALAGDPPADGSPATGDFTYALELVELVRSRGDNFSVSVAAHPELHPRSTDRASDRKHLARKLSAADMGISQFFFDADDYFRMVDELAALGCDTPVHPGVMPMANPAGVRRMTAMAGATFPDDLAQRVESASDEDRHKIIVDAALELSRRLLDGGAPGVHLYGLNRAEVVVEVARELGLAADTTG